MVKFPTPSEVAAMQTEDQTKTMELVNRFVTFLRPTLATARPNGFGETAFRVPPGFLKPGEKWNWNHSEEFQRRVCAAGWQIVNKVWLDEDLQHSSFTLKPKPTT